MKEVLPVFSAYHRIHHLFFQCMSKTLTNPAVHPGQAALLGRLAEHGSLSQAELCRSLQVSGAAVAVSIRRMEKQGFISRKQNPEDMREKLLYITPLGEKTAVEISNAIAKVQLKAIEGFSEEELAQLNSYLTRVADNLNIFKELSTEAASARKEQGE